MPAALFLNVDLDLASSDGLEALVEAMKPYVIVLNNEQKQFVSLELSTVQPTTIDDAIARYALLVNQLAVEHRKIWNQCSMRRMSIGIQSHGSSHQSSFCISEESLALLCDLKAEVAFTVYAP